LPAALGPWGSKTPPATEAISCIRSDAAAEASQQPKNSPSNPVIHISASK